MWRTHSCVPRAHSWARFLAAIAITLLTTASPGLAAIAGVWGINALEKAPVLVVGQVISVEKSERATEEFATWHYEVWRMTADIRVLRSFKTGEPLSRDHIQLSFLQYAPAQAMSSPPPLPSIDPGATLVLPLQKNDDPSQPWKLLDKTGRDLTIPATADFPDSVPLPSNAHAFLLGELANVIVGGNRSEVLAAGRYLRSEPGGTSRELLPLIESQVAPNDQNRWLDIATGLVTGGGIPRPKFAELRDTAPKIPDWALIARAATQKLGESQSADILIIEKLLADAPINAWGAAMSLIEFGDNPVLTQRLRQALSDDVEGTSYIAWTLARNGHKAFLDDALSRALRVCDRPTGNYTDLQGAAASLRDFGSDRQLDQLAALVRKYQTGDRTFYGVLWQYSTEADNPRETRVLSVVLNDRNPLHGDMRVCDFALGMLERATGEHFSANAQSKDDAIARARAWLDAHHIPR